MGLTKVQETALLLFQSACVAATHAKSRLSSRGNAMSCWTCLEWEAMWGYLPWLVGLARPAILSVSSVPPPPPSPPSPRLLQAYQPCSLHQRAVPPSDFYCLPKCGHSNTHSSLSPLAFTHQSHAAIHTSLRYTQPVPYRLDISHF